MKALLGMVLGENPAAPYEPEKYGRARAPPPPGGLPPHEVGWAPPARDSSPALLYGQAGPAPHGGAEEAPEKVPLGPWILGPSSAGLWTPGAREMQDQTLPLQARTQIAVCSAPMGCTSTAASYENETFMSPWETTQPVIATGQLVNTWTGEVADTYESALPPPNRKAGDAVRGRHQQQRRLLAAEGNINASHRKREQQLPMQAGDAGGAQQQASFAINQDVALERNQRGARDIYFNRTELAPCEMESTRNPFGFEGYNNRLRVLPWQPVTQELENKDWTPNATVLPGGERPKQVVRLRQDAPESLRMGVSVTPAVLGADARAQVRASVAARDVEGHVDPGRGVGATQTTGSGGAAAFAGELRLSPEGVRGAAPEASGRGLESVVYGDAAPLVAEQRAAKTTGAVEASFSGLGGGAGRQQGGMGGATPCVGETRLGEERCLARGSGGAVGGLAALGSMTVSQESVLKSLGLVQELALPTSRLTSFGLEAAGGGLPSDHRPSARAEGLGGGSRSAQPQARADAAPVSSQAQARKAEGQPGGGLGSAVEPAGRIAATCIGALQGEAARRSELMSGHPGAMGLAHGTLGASTSSAQEASGARSLEISSGGRLVWAQPSLDSGACSSLSEAAHPKRQVDGQVLLEQAATRGLDAAVQAPLSASASSTQKRQEGGRWEAAGTKRLDAALEAAASASTSSFQKRQELLLGGGPRAAAAHVGAEAAGHGGLSEFQAFREERLQRARPGIGEMTQAMEARSGARGSHQRRQAEQPIYRQTYEKHGGPLGADFQQRAPRAHRETVAECVVQPRLTLGPRDGGHRAELLGAREPRPPRLAKSPFKAQRSFVQDRTRLFGEVQDRCSDTVEV